MKAATDDSHSLGVLAAQLLGGDRRHGAGAKRGHRAHVNERERLSVGGDDTQIIPITR